MRKACLMTSAIDAAAQAIERRVGDRIRFAAARPLHQDKRRSPHEWAFQKRRERRPRFALLEVRQGSHNPRGYYGGPGGDLDRFWRFWRFE